MWPDLFGTGWIWGVLVSAGFLAIGAAVIRAALAETRDATIAVKQRPD
jgi:hypothetical protein